MRLHSDLITDTDIRRAVALVPGAYAETTVGRSRTRRYGITFKLSATDKGTARRHGNSGQYGSMGQDEDYALMWDEWGIILAALFDVDPNAVMTYYESAENYHWQTGHRFAGTVGIASGNDVGSIIFRLTDKGAAIVAAPHTHRWERSDESVTGSYHVSQCKGSKGQTCPATRRFMVYGRSFAEISEA